MRANVKDWKLLGGGIVRFDLEQITDDDKVFVSTKYIVNFYKFGYAHNNGENGVTLVVDQYNLWLYYFSMQQLEDLIIEAFKKDGD